MHQMDDIRTLQKYSREAAMAVIEIGTFCGRDMADKVLDGMWSLLAGTGVLDPRAV